MTNEKFIAKEKSDGLLTIIVILFLASSYLCLRIFKIATEYNPIPYDGLFVGVILIFISLSLLYSTTRLRIKIFYDDRIEIRNLIGGSIKTLYFSNLMSWYIIGSKDEKEDGRSLMLRFEDVECPKIESTGFKNIDAVIESLKKVKPEDNLAEADFEKKSNTWAPYIIGAFSAVWLLVGGLIIFFSLNAKVNRDDLFTIKGNLLDSAFFLRGGGIRNSSLLEIKLHQYPQLRFRATNVSIIGDTFIQAVHPGDMVSLSILKKDFKSYISNHQLIPFWSEVFELLDDTYAIKAYEINAKGTHFLDYTTNNEYEDKAILTSGSIFGTLFLLSLGLGVFYYKKKKKS